MVALGGASDGVDWKPGCFAGGNEGVACYHTCRHSRTSWPLPSSALAAALCLLLCLLRGAGADAAALLEATPYWRLTRLPTRAGGGKERRASGTLCLLWCGCAACAPPAYNSPAIYHARSCFLLRRERHAHLKTAYHLLARSLGAKAHLGAGPFRVAVVLLSLCCRACAAPTLTSSPPLWLACLPSTGRWLAFAGRRKEGSCTLPTAYLSTHCPLPPQLGRRRRAGSLPLALPHTAGRRDGIKVLFVCVLQNAVRTWTTGAAQRQGEARRTSHAMRTKTQNTHTTLRARAACAAHALPARRLPLSTIHPRRARRFTCKKGAVAPYWACAAAANV